MVKYAGEGSFSRRDLNWLFGRKTGRPDAECWELEGFVISTMMGNSWDCKCLRDAMDFMNEFGVHVTTWRRWLAGSDKDADRWAVVEKPDGVPKWTWFEKSMRIGEWTAMHEECAVSMRLVPNKNGFFKTEPL